MSRSRASRSRIQTTLGAIALTAGALALVATPSIAGDVGASPSDTEHACLAVDGEFSQEVVDAATTLNTCVVETVVVDPPVAGGGNKNWKVELTHTTTTTYTTTWAEVPTGMVCYNPAGNGIPVTAWDPVTNQGNPNCVAAAAAGGQQTTPPFFTIAATFDWGITERSEAAVTETALTNCWNPGGEPHQNGNHCTAP